MIKFREHRGTLKESLKTIKEFKGLTALFHYLMEQYSIEQGIQLPKLYMSDFNISCYGYDERCNQTLYIVFAPSPYGVFGFIFEENEIKQNIN